MLLLRLLLLLLLLLLRRRWSTPNYNSTHAPNRQLTKLKRSRVHGDKRGRLRHVSNHATPTLQLVRWLHDSLGVHGLLLLLLLLP